MTGSGVINQLPANSCALNGTDYRLVVHNATIQPVVNPRASGYLNAQPTGLSLINGPLPSEIKLIQNYVLDVADAWITLAAGSPELTMIYLMQVNNARIPLMSDHILFSRTQGGALLVLVETPDADVYRFSFEGVKA